MKYLMNPSYRMETRHSSGHGTLHVVVKDHRDDIVIIDKKTYNLLKDAETQSGIDIPDGDQTAAVLSSEGILYPSVGQKMTPYTESMNFWLQVTDTCNLACNYCYIPSLNSKRKFESQVFDLLAEKLCAVQGLRSVNIKLAGGEPLIAFRQWKKGIVALKHHLADQDINLQLRIITNLTLLTDEIIQFIVEHDIAVSVSLDGLATWHDKNRIYTGTQKGSFETVERNITRLKAAGITPSVMVTVTTENYRGVPELVRYLIAKDITFRLADAKGGYIRPEEFTATMDKVHKALKAGQQRGFPVSRRVVVSDLRTHYPSSTPCSMGKNSAAIYLDGDIYFCHTEFEKGRPIGHLSEKGNLLEIIQRGKTKHTGLSDDCQKCEYRLVCAGGCPLYRVNGKSPMCHSYKKIIKQVFELYEQERL